MPPESTQETTLTPQAPAACGDGADPDQRPDADPAGSHYRTVPAPWGSLGTPKKDLAVCRT